MGVNMKTLRAAVVVILLLIASTAAADIWRDCKSRWGSNQSMVDYCVKTQKEAYSAVKSSRGIDGDIKNSCRDRWGTNYEMVKYCMDNQSSAQRDLKAISTSSNIENECRTRWGTNYEMVKYCIEKKDPAANLSYKNTNSNTGAQIRSASTTGWSTPVQKALPLTKLSGQENMKGLHVAQCPKCNMTFAFTDSMSGMNVNCDRCNQPRIIP